MTLMFIYISERYFSFLTADYVNTVVFGAGKRDS